MNATCGVTQLPIKDQTSVVAYPLIVRQPDFMARDALSGIRCVRNHLTAMPFALPVGGIYKDGKVDTREGDLGLKLFKDLLQYFVDKDMLMRDINANPEPVQSVPEDCWAALCAGHLLVRVPNERKAWLQQLKKLRDSHPDKASFELYESQLKVDPESLPDHTVLALGVMLVPTALHHKLTEVAGAQPAVGVFEEDGTEVIFEGSRAEELRHWATPSEEHRARARTAVTVLQAGIADGSLPQKNTERAIAMLYVAAVKHAFDHQTKALFAPEAGYRALRAAVMDKDVAARELWVTMELFCHALASMSKQWTVQPVACSSDYWSESKVLYQATAQFMTEQLEQ